MQVTPAAPGLRASWPLETLERDEILRCLTERGHRGRRCRHAGHRLRATPYPEDRPVRHHHAERSQMIFIVVRWPIKPEFADQWLDPVDDFTRGTRAEPGNLFFDWSRDVDDPSRFTLVEAFADADAGGAHVASEHFQAAMAWMPDKVSATPEIINVEIPTRPGGRRWVRCS